MSQDKSQSKEIRGKTQKSASQNEDFIPRPDRSKFLDELNSLRSQLDGARTKLSKRRSDIENQSSNGGQSPEESKLRDEHSTVVSERNRLRDVERKINTEADRIDEAVKRKISELQTLRPKNGPRSVKELDAKVKQLESTMDSGTLSIVEEQKVLREVSALKKQRATFGQADKLQTEIDEIRKKASDLRKTVDQAALRKVTARKAELEKQLDTYKKDRQSRRDQMNSLYDDRRKIQAEIKDINSKMDALRKDFDTRMEDFNNKLKAKKQQREAEEKVAKAEQAKQKKITEAKAKLTAAQEPAFGHHIEQAKSLLAYFDPSYAENKPASTDASASSAEKAGSKSSVSKAIKSPAAPAGETIAPQQTSQAPPSRKSQKLKAKESSGSGKLHFDFAIVDALSSLNIALPTSTEDIESTKEKIKEKIAYYVEHNERVTKEKVDRAEKELQQVMADLEKKSAAPAEAKTEA